MTGRVDPLWGDDLMAIAEAVGIVNQSPERQKSGDLIVLADYIDCLHPDQPIPYLPTDHEVCHGCGDLLCGCEIQCAALDRDHCSHDGKPYCPGCAQHYCATCRVDLARWDRPDRGDL